MAAIEVVAANPTEFPAAQDFYESRGYGGAAIKPSDFVVLAKRRDRIVGVGRLCQEGDLLWLRGMQVEPELQRQGVGSRILNLLSQEIGARSCCCLPYGHLVSFYQQASFRPASGLLPPAMETRLASYLDRGLNVVAMLRAAVTA